ncbi:Pecanex-like protein 4, partial [Armadillidium nasatum]
LSRIAVKLSLDHVLVGPINNCWSDLEAALSEYNDDWYVGPDKCKNINPNVCNDATWDQAIKKEIPNLFSLGYNEMKGQYTSHLLTLGDTEINVGKLEDEVVRSIWVSLSGELLYFTNDDDERYSIQAHSVLLRNLTIQAADPPLGYPIYSSQPVSHGLT